jgi:transposase InsO family protein
MRTWEVLLQEDQAAPRVRCRLGVTVQTYHRWREKRGGARLDFIRPGKPIENVYIESFNGRIREESPNVETFFSLEDARRKLERWRIDSGKSVNELLRSHT